MQTRAIGEVETVEQNKSEKDLLEKSVADCKQRRSTFLADISYCVQYERNQNNYHDYQQHKVAVADEVRRIADSLYPSWSKGACLQPSIFGWLVLIHLELGAIGPR